MAEIPQTVVPCAGCEKDLNLLNPHLTMKLAAKRDVLIAEDKSTDLNSEDETKVYLGSKVGRGVVKPFHDFDCLGKWVGQRKGLKAKIELHHEDEIYEPADNRTPEELYEDGEISEAVFALSRIDGEGEE